VKGRAALADFRTLAAQAVPRPLPGYIWQVLIFFILYLLLYRSSNIFHTTDLRATPWNPESGLAVAAGIVLGWPAVPVIAVANFAATMLMGVSLSAFWTAMSAIASAAVFAGGGVYWRQGLTAMSRPTLKAVLFFMAFAVAVTGISALARLIVAMAALGITPSYLLPYILTGAVGNLIGIMTIVPLCVIFGSPSRFLRYLRGRELILGLLLVLTFAISIVVFGLKVIDQFKFFYLVFIPVIAFTLRDGIKGAAVSVLAANISMIVILLIRNFEPSTVTELQVLMISLSATGLFLGATVSERNSVRRQLEISLQQLHDSQAALQQASRISLASEMAAALSHELSQPLSAVRNYVRAVRRQLDQPKPDRESVRQSIDAAVVQVDQAADLIRTTRRFLEKGDSAKQPTDLWQLINSCTTLVEPEFSGAGIAIVLNRPAELPLVFCNDVQMQQVVFNLLRNSKEALIDAGPALPRREILISVSAEHRPGFVEITIADSGPGVPRSLRSSLFMPWITSKPGGLGLGLSLCETIIRSHGGEIWLDASGREGARFAFTVPVATQTEVAGEA
jgi:signal transduction histidine kinase